MSLKGKEGFILIVCYMAIIVLMILSTAFLNRSINEKKLAERERDSIQALWLAEAGVDRALIELKNDYSLNGEGLWPTSLGQGQYSVDISAGGNDRKVISHGYIPLISSPLAERVIEAVIRKDIPDNFYNNVLTVATKLELKENYNITGDPNASTGNMIYGGTYEASGSGTITDSTPINDPSINPLPLLDLEQLYNISSDQGNVYDEDRLEDVEDGGDSFPASFWYDEAEAIPNVVFVQSDLEIKENFGIVGGFIIVVGDVLTDPEATGSTELKGDGIIEGCIYTTGKFEVSGGDISGISINGSIWVGEDAEIKGNTSLTYDETYMQAIGALDLYPGAQIVSWREV